MRELLVDGRESQGDPIELECPLEMKRRGSEVRLILANHKEELAPVASLERVVARARIGQTESLQVKSIRKPN